MLGYDLITKQTGSKGLKVEAVMISEGVKIEKEFYLAFLLDRSRQCPAIVASTRGGMNIEEVAAKEPDQIVVQPINP